MEQQFEYDGLNVTVWTATVRDNANRRRWAQRIAPFEEDDGVAQDLMWDFLTLMRCSKGASVSSGRKPRYLPNLSPAATREEILQGFEDFQNLHGEFVEAWKELEKSVNRPLNDRQFLPPDQLTDEEKKSTPVSEASGEKE